MNQIIFGSLLIVVTIQLASCFNFEDVSNCPSGWTPGGTKCYMATTKKVAKMQEAKDACKALDAKATLPTTHDSQELQDLVSAFNKSAKLDVYISLNYDDPTHSWLWEDKLGDPKHYHPWSPDADYSGDTLKCANIDLGKEAKNLWNTNDCSQSKDVVCQQIVPTLKDVYSAIAKIQQDVAVLADMKTKVDTLAGIKENVDKLFAQCKAVKKTFF